MTLQQLQYVVALDTFRHFAKAAESVFVAQPTLTIQVKKLEEEIGFQLFDRSSQPIIPTATGEQFILRARHILGEVHNLKRIINEDKGNLAGTYKIGVIPTLAPYLLPRFLGAFSAAFPEVKLEIAEMQSLEILRQLKNDQLDIGILVSQSKESHIREIPLFNEPFLIYAHEGHELLKKKTLRAEDVRSKDLWLLQQGHCFRNQVINLCGSDLPAIEHPYRFESGSIETVKNLVRMQEGFTLVPELSVNFETEKHLLRRFPNPEPAREICLSVRSSFSKERLLIELRASILAHIPNEFQKSSKFMQVMWR